jgi:hypothetical protein
MRSESVGSREAIRTIRQLPFVRSVQLTRTSPGPDHGYDGRLEITTPARKFRLVFEAKGTNISSHVAEQLLAWRRHRGTRQVQNAILLARFVPRPAAEALIAAKVNFADEAGNIHLQLGDRYSWTSIGNSAPQPASERRPITPAQLELLFQFVTNTESVNWPVRKLESATGVSKSGIAKARNQLVIEGLLSRIGKKHRLGAADVLAERLVSGYGQVLRPKLTLGRFRPAEETAGDFLKRLGGHTPPGIRYSLTGGQAAEIVQHYYRGPEVTLFLDPPTRDAIRQLRVFPDRQGPVTILKAFGEMVFGEERGRQRLAPPWLIYAELLSSKDPRAHEAAAEFRKLLPDATTEQ